MRIFNFEIKKECRRQHPRLIKWCCVYRVGKECRRQHPHLSKCLYMFWVWKECRMQHVQEAAPQLEQVLCVQGVEGVQEAAPPLTKCCVCAGCGRSAGGSSPT